MRARVVRIGAALRAFVARRTARTEADEFLSLARRGGVDFAVDVWLGDVRRWPRIMAGFYSRRRSVVVAQCRHCSAWLLVFVHHRWLFPTQRSMAADYVRDLRGQGCSCVRREADRDINPENGSDRSVPSARDHARMVRSDRSLY